MQKAVLSLRGGDGFFVYGIEKELREENLNGFYIKKRKLQREPVSIAECSAFCSETTFS